MKEYNADYDKLITIARTYYYIKGEFSTRQLYNFILSHNFGFSKEITSKSIGMQLAKSSLFNKVRKKNNTWYEVIE